MTAYSRHPETLLFVAFICTCYGLNLIKKGIQGYTLIPGTNFSYWPRWLLITAGIILQAFLPLAYCFLTKQGVL